MHHLSTMKMVEFQQQIKILHWQTTSYARHKAYGNLYENLDELIDKFVEISMGKYGRLKLSEKNSTLTLKNLKEISINNLLKDFCNFLSDLSNKFDSQTDTDILNIRDEILGEVNKLKYLLTLK